MLSFTGFRKCVIESIENAWDYLEFMLIEDVSLPVVKQGQMDSWSNIKRGFDSAKDPNTRKQLGKAGRKMRSELLGAEGSNPKLAKEAENVPTYLTKGLSLSPADESGRVNFCACASPECRQACLNKTGRGTWPEIQKSRVKKTDFLVDNPGHFVSMLHDELSAHARGAIKKGKRAAARLNIVSDIPWEKIHPEIFTDHPDVKFYDYTKIAARVLKPDGSKQKLPDNYHLTLSSTGVHEKSNWDHVRQHLNNGGVSAMVFAVPAGRNGNPGGPLPTHVHDEETGKRYRVIDGDLHDHRHLDHVYNAAHPSEGLIAGLRIKGGKKNLERAGDFAVRVPTGSSVVSVPSMKRKPEYFTPELAKKRSERPF